MEYRERVQLKWNATVMSSRTVRFNNTPKYRYIPANPTYPSPQNSISERMMTKMSDFERLVAVIEKLNEQGMPVPRALWEKARALKMILQSEGIVV